MGNLYCKCNNCKSIFNESLLDNPCPFCGDSLNYKESEVISNYFTANSKLPKLNDPKDFIYHFNNYGTPATNGVHTNYLTRSNNKKYHIFSIVPVYQFVNDRHILIELCFVWDNDFENKAFGIIPNPNDSLKLQFSKIIFKNLLFNDINRNYNLKIFNKVVSDTCYEKFLRVIDDIKSSFNISDYFSLYNSINWDLLDDKNQQKTCYEYSAVNYFLNICKLIKMPIDVNNFDYALLSLDAVINDLRIENDYSDNYISAEEFKTRFLNNDENPLLESVEFSDYEDIFDYFSVYRENAIAPNAVGLNAAAQRSSTVFNKLYELGYKPEMNIYSVGEATSLCPTFEKDGTTYFIECNNNIMMGINEFDSIDEMKDVLNEVYNEEDNSHLFLTIKGLTPEVLKHILRNSKTNKDFLTSLVNLNNKDNETYTYEDNIYDEYKVENSPVSEFDVKEMTPQTLFKYSRTFYKLKNYTKLGGNQHGFMFIDKNDNVIGFIIVEDKTYDIQTEKRTIPTIVALEAASDYKSSGIELAMIEYYKNKKGVQYIRIEPRNLLLADRIKDSNEFREIHNDNSNIYPLYESIIDGKVLTEAINSSKRKQIEEKVYKVFDLLDKTGGNTQKYKTFFKSMSDDQFDKYIKNFIHDDTQNFYLEILPNKSCPRIKDCVNALNYLNVPTEEYVYYKQDGHEKDPIRSRYKVPILYVNLKRVQQMLSKKNTYSLDISKRNMKTG